MGGGNTKRGLTHSHCTSGSLLVMPTSTKKRKGQGGGMGRPLAAGGGPGGGGGCTGGGGGGDGIPHGLEKARRSGAYIGRARVCFSLLPQWDEGSSLRGNMYECACVLMSHPEAGGTPEGATGLATGGGGGGVDGGGGCGGATGLGSGSPHMELGQRSVEGSGDPLHSG